MAFQKFLSLNADGFLEEAVVTSAAAARRVVTAQVIVTTAPDTDVAGPASNANLDTDLGDLSIGDFVTAYDLLLNGTRLVNGANLAAAQDVYPGTALGLGQLRFARRLVVGDIITVIAWAS